MPTASTPAVRRIEVRPSPAAGDPRAAALAAQARALGLEPGGVRTARVYLIQSDLGESDLARVCAGLLADPVLERAHAGASADPAGGSVIEVHPLAGVMDPAAGSVREAISALTGTDAAVSTGWRYEFDGLDAGDARRLAERLLANPVVQAIHTGAFCPASLPSGHEAAFRLTHIPITGLDDAGLARLSREAHLFLSPDEMRTIRDHYRALGREPTDIELETLAQTWSEHCVHKTLKSTIRYRETETEGRRDGETKLRMNGRPGHEVQVDGSVVIRNLLKSTVAAATNELIAEGLDWTLSVFKDNAGVIAFDDDHAVCVKVETHNHPSAIEPYGGAATGIGGCIRDVIGTGLGAKPIASTDVFCVAPPGLADRVFVPNHADFKHSEAAQRVGDLLDGNHVYTARLGLPGHDGWREIFVYRGVRADDGHKEFESDPLDASQWYPRLMERIKERERDQGGHWPFEHRYEKGVPEGCLPPRRILTEVVAGVRDYGNRMGIPTVNGAVWFDERHVGNPLVFCGCIGVMPRGEGDALIHGAARPGDRIVALGGRTGRDGIHGATFSSAELTDTHADEFAHAVQIGNAIEEKRTLDAILRARDAAGGPLYHAITDCGAGGFSSAVGEMGAEIGAEVDLDRAPLKYDGLTYTEIWISEAQERMVLAVPEASLPALRAICAEEHVELADLGRFGTPGAELVLRFRGEEVGRLSMHLLHEGIPMPTREAIWGGSDGATEGRSDGGKGRHGEAPSIQEALLALLAHPNIASKHWIIRQYDHEVQGATVVKPLVGPMGRGPSDGAVVEPVPGTGRGLAIACGLATGLEADPYTMALAAIDECVRNLVCVGADPDRIAILDNFCWPGCESPEKLAALVRAAEGCYDGAKAYRTPFVSGKDSLNNQFTTADGRTIAIPPTLLISGIGVVGDIARCVTSDLKRSGNPIFVVEPSNDGAAVARMGGSHYTRMFGFHPEGLAEPPRVDLVEGPRQARAVATAIGHGLVAACHDSSDGGPLVAVAEMLIAGHSDGQPLGVEWLDLTPQARLWSERPSCYVVEVHADREDEFVALMGELGGGWTRVGRVTDTGALRLPGPGEVSIPVEDLASAWRAPLDW